MRWWKRLYYTWNEVQWQIHEVADRALDAESAEGVLENLSESLHGILAGLQLSAFAQDLGLILGNQSSVKSIKQGVLQHEVLRNHRDDDGALVEHQKNGGEDCQGSVEEHHDAELG